jgi:hypothetical protein
VQSVQAWADNPASAPIVCGRASFQIETPAEWDPANFHRGLRLILAGLFKKAFVADNCALIANYAFAAGRPQDRGASPGGWNPG